MKISIITFIMLISLFSNKGQQNTGQVTEPVEDFYALSFKTIRGEAFSFEQLRGKRFYWSTPLPNAVLHHNSRNWKPYTRSIFLTWSSWDFLPMIS